MNKKAEKIINTTIKLFVRDGIKKVTMDEIAQSANVSKVTIYKYFEDKDFLYAEVCRYIFSSYAERLKCAALPDRPLLHRLYDFIDIVCDFTDSGRFQVCTELAKYSDAAENEQRLYEEAYRQCMLTLIDEGLEHSLMRPDLSRDMLYHYIDMGVAYYEQNAAYRNRMRGENEFSKRFMLFYIGNIFVDAAGILPPS